MPRFGPLLFLSLASVVLAQTYTATYTPDDAPDKTQNGQTGTNKCGTGSDQGSMCQTIWVNSLDDWCIFGPPVADGSDIGNTEQIEVAWCTQSGHGTRVIPSGAITGAHFVQTPDYVQVTGAGDLTKINVARGDSGGELDPHGADGNGNPIGGLVFSTAFGDVQQLHEWTNFIASDEFCIRACKDGPNAPALCQHIYDVMGCGWNMPGNYDAGSFDSCKGDTGEPMGVYGASTFHQGDASTPPPHPAPATSMCSAVSTIGGGVAAAATPAPTSDSQRAKMPESGVAPSPFSRSSSRGSSTPSAAVHVKSNGVMARLGCGIEWVAAGVLALFAAGVVA